ncbi:MAG: MerR family transcriptional regulator, partial [Ilumatobacter sp.]|uniref:MerR family transcriptional regulator n=1 Tax=Ilumatobacter sp. TaxID=1967498 RepID=UPI003C78BE18
MMNIGEFARRTGLSISAIRFYGDRGLLEPIDIDPSSGYRSDAVDQVEPARMIADLRRMNMPLVDIERVLESSDIEQRSVVLEHVERLETAVDRAHDIAHSLGAQPTRHETPMTITTTSTTSTTTTSTTTMTTLTATLDARSLGQALEQVLPAAGRSASKPHLMCGAVLLSTSGEGLTLQRRDIRIDVAASCEGPDVDVALDPRYVADALSVAVGVEAVIEIADALRPVMLRSADDGTY